ncbi:MAG: hypothetical protein ACI9H6_000565 [Patiriisocius sp.]|jgi:hypothetical protein
MDKKTHRRAVEKIITAKLVRTVVDATVPGKSLQDSDPRLLSALNEIAPLVKSLLEGRYFDPELSPGETAATALKA